jgi:hypothetical protein
MKMLNDELKDVNINVQEMFDSASDEEEVYD